MLGFTASRYTGAIPATYAGPGQLGSDFPCGKYAWAMWAGGEQTTQIGATSKFKHLLTV